MVRLGLHFLVLFAACAATTLPPAAVTPGPLAAAAGPPGAAAPAGLDAGWSPADQGIEADFQNAKASFEGGKWDAARSALEGFVTAHPDHPLRASAEILLARLALVRGDASAAKVMLEPLATATATDPAVAAHARYYLGLAELRLRNPGRARELLTPFLPRPGAPAGDTEDGTLVELRGALAEAHAATGDPAGALELWDGYLRGATEAERAFARLRAVEIAAQLPPEVAARAFSAAPPGSLARAVLGSKAAAQLRAQGDATGAGAAEADAARARRALGFDDPAQGLGAGDPTRIGVALPLSGRLQPVGEAAMRGAMLAAGAPVAAGQTSMQMVVRDTAGEADRALRGSAELARDEGAIAIVGAVDRRAAVALLAQAGQDGIPVLTLDEQPPGAASTGFQVIHATEARASELARRAMKLGARDFAILGPDSAGGKRLRDAFRREVVAGGGRITAESTYLAGATSFSAAIAPIKKAPPQAVFVADGADRLELIAPALAAADLWPQPWGKPRAAAEPGRPRVRQVLLLSTANDLTPRLVQNAGRYVQGALLAPGFFADEGDPGARAFVEAYRAAYGQDPHATEAYAYDAVAMVKSLTERGGARTRADLVRALGAPSYDGVTGKVRFGADHARTDPPVLYVVDGDQIHAIR